MIKRILIIFAKICIFIASLLVWGFSAYITIHFLTPFKIAYILVYIDMIISILALFGFGYYLFIFKNKTWYRFFILTRATLGFLLRKHDIISPVHTHKTLYFVLYQSKGDLTMNDGASFNKFDAKDMLISLLLDAACFSIEVFLIITDILNDFYEHLKYKSQTLITFLVLSLISIVFAIMAEEIMNNYESFLGSYYLALLYIGLSVVFYTTTIVTMSLSGYVLFKDAYLKEQ